jgi:hypothetical protein
MLLEKYLDAYRPTDGLLGLKPNGVARVLTHLESLTGIRCDPLGLLSDADRKYFQARVDTDYDMLVGEVAVG